MFLVTTRRFEIGRGVDARGPYMYSQSDIV